MEFKIAELVAATISGITLWAFNKAHQSNIQAKQLKANQEYAKLYNYLKNAPENTESITTICEQLCWSPCQLKKAVKRAPFRFCLKGKLVKVNC